MEANEEQIILVIQKVSDRRRGGFFDVVVTDRRMIVDKLIGGAYWADALRNDKNSQLQSTVAFGVVGGALSNAANKSAAKSLNKKVAEYLAECERSGRIEAILKMQKKKIVIPHDEVVRAKLSRRCATACYSKMVLKNKGKKRIWVFPREQYDAVSSELAKILKERIKIG